MKGSQWNDLTGAVLPWALLFASLAVFLTYLIPEWASFFSSEVFVFTNGWDEESYLSWQGMLGFKSVPGYFPLYLNWAMEQVGLSGALQNLIFDTVLPPATAFLVFLTLRIWDIEPFKAAAYATLICFGSVLFNANNPLVSAILGDSRSNSILIMAGWEVYTSIVRTPNPEVAFFLIACAVWSAARFRRWWLLLVPLPVLYYPTAVAYAYLLLLAFCYRELRLRVFSHTTIAIVVASVITFVTMGIGLTILSYAMGLYSPDDYFRNISYVFTETRRPQIPVGLIALTALFGLGSYFGLLRLDRRLTVATALLGIASLGAVNLHIFTGFMLSQKNYYDYGLSVFFAILVAFAINSLRHDWLKGTALVVTLFVITSLSYRSQMIWYRKSIQLSKELAPDIERLRKDPLHAIIPNLEMAHHVAYSTPLLLSPISDVYLMKFANVQCSALSKLTANATTFLNDRFAAESVSVSDLRQIIDQISEVNRRYKKSIPDEAYCKNHDFSGNKFYLAGPRQP